MIAYPNPFSDQATIQFKLNKASDVSIAIYDITGKSVRRIEAGNYLAGEHTFNVQKGDLKSGIYILRMNTGDNAGFTKISVK